jgi:UDP-N-acetylglucosamine 2-epimerase (non-hydrolysing)
MDEGVLIMSGLKAERVLHAVRVATLQHNKTERTFRIVPDYEGGAVSKKVLGIVLSYVDFINREVWSK